MRYGRLRELRVPSIRALTVGLILTITVVASESLAVTTVMPLVARDHRLPGPGLWPAGSLLTAGLHCTRLRSPVGAPESGQARSLANGTRACLLNRPARVLPSGPNGLPAQNRHRANRSSRRLQARERLGLLRSRTGRAAGAHAPASQVAVRLRRTAAAELPPGPGRLAGPAQTAAIAVGPPARRGDISRRAPA